MGSQYEEDGTLTAALFGFVELRRVAAEPGGQEKTTEQPAAASMRAAARAGDGVAAATAPPAAGGATPAAAAAPSKGQGGAPDDDLGPSRYSQLGPPRPAAPRGDVIAPEGGWAALYEQLRQRRSQLASTPGAAAGTPGAAAAMPTAPHSAPPAAGRLGGDEQRPAGARGSSLTPGPGRGATRPRGGVRRTALGPMLRLLRESDALS